jgi:hypothetical protein
MLLRRVKPIRLILFKSFLVSALLAVQVISWPLMLPKEQPLSVISFQLSGGEALSFWNTFASSKNRNLRFSLHFRKAFADLANFTRPTAKEEKRGASVWSFPIISFFRR